MLSILSMRLWFGKIFFGTIGSPEKPSGIRVSPSRVVKGPCDSAELEALQYIAANTTIPAPKVFRSHQYRGRLYIELEYIHGDDLATTWREHLTIQQKGDIINELAGYISQLRSLKPPREGTVASAYLKECREGRIGSAPFRPFQTHDEFHLCLRGGIPLESCTEVFDEAVTRCHSQKYRSCFTHADLCLRNIVCRGGKIAGIIDWEFAGWYPEYWEYTKAHYNMLDGPEWYKLLETALPSYDEELVAERVLWKKYDQPRDVELRTRQLPGRAGG